MFIYINIYKYYTSFYIAGENIENGPYKPDWDYFIASNLHFYTTLLALFLRTVSLSSLNPTDAYGRPFLDTLDKVLRVFSGLLLTTINDLTSEFNSWYEYEIKQKLSQRPTHSASRSGKGSSKTPTSARTPLYSPLTLNSRASLDHDSSSTPVSVELAAIRLAIKCQHQYLFPDYNDNYFINAASMLKHGDNISVIPVITKVCAQYGENLHTSLRRLLRVTPDSYALQAWEGYIEFFKLNGNSNNLVHLHHDIENMMTQLRIVLNRPAASLLRANSSYDPSSDVLDRPTTASEWSALVLVTVGVSKFLNSILDLPRDSYLVNMELQEAIDYIRHQHKDIKAQAVALLHSARFNFRGLANITVSVVITLIFIVRFFIYVSFGWFTVWQMIRNIAAPFIVTTILRLVEHWYRVESKHVSDTTDRGFVVWDNQTGKLTDYGKEMLLQGQLECKKENLRFIGDELTLPCHTFEYSFLYHLGVKLSQYLNTRYRLPINTDDISLPWKIIIKSAWMNRRNQNPLIMISQALRFNLRFLASKHYLFWGFLMLVLSYVFFPLYLKIVIAMSVLMLVSLIVTLERRLVR